MDTFIPRLLLDTVIEFKGVHAQPHHGSPCAGVCSFAVKTETCRAFPFWRQVILDCERRACAETSRTSYFGKSIARRGGAAAAAYGPVP